VQREYALAGGVVLVIVAALLVAVLAPDAVLVDHSDTDHRPSHVSLHETTITPADVSGNTATLTLDVRLRHRGGPAENVSLEVRAIDAESGLVETRTRIEVGTLDGDSERAVLANVTVERSGGYHVETIVYADGRRVEQGRTTISGVEALVPAFARTPIEFHRFANGVPTITYTIANASGGQATLDVSTYLTNTGSTTAGDLELTIAARQVDSNVIADRAQITVGQIRAGRTVAPTTQLTVPDEYNYRLDAVLWRDGVIVGTASSVAQLDPTTEVPTNVTRTETRFRASDFETSGSDQGVEPPTTTSAGAGPGFGVGLALLAVLAATLIARRNT
jgi:PGF-CTERM protein